MYERKIASLQETHAQLEQQLIEAEATLATDEEIHTIKKLKLHAKDMIRDLTNLDNAGREFK